MNSVFVTYIDSDCLKLPYINRACIYLQIIVNNIKLLSKGYFDALNNSGAPITT